MTTSLKDKHTKDLFKQAMLELFQERRDLFYDLFAEIIEDTAMVNAIREGEATDSVSRAKIFQIIKGTT